MCGIKVVGVWLGSDKVWTIEALKDAEEQQDERPAVYFVHSPSLIPPYCTIQCLKLHDFFNLNTKCFGVQQAFLLLNPFSLDVSW